jgi:DNA-binding protein Fis
MNQVRQLVSLSDNEITILQDCLKFQIKHYFEKDNLLDIERLYAMKLGEIQDRLDKYLRSK